MIITGAAFGLVSSEQFGNLARGHGWKSNQQVIEGLFSSGNYQDAIDFATDVYGIEAGKNIATYDPALSSSTRGITQGNFTTRRVSDLKIGSGAFTAGTPNFEESLLQGTLFHEGVHVEQFTSGKGASVFTNLGRRLGRRTLEGEAYASTLKNAGRLHLTKAVRNYYSQRFLNYTGRTFQGSFLNNIPLRNSLLNLF